MSRALQKWRSPTNPIINRATKEAALLEKWDFAVVIPRPDRATADAAQLLAGDRPVCILVPTDFDKLCGNKFEKRAVIQLEDNEESSSCLKALVILGQEES